MKKIAELVLKFRVLLLSLIFVFSIIVILGLKKIKVESDVVKYLRQDDPDVKIFNYIGENYGGTQLALIAIEADDIFTYRVLGLINTLTEEYHNLEGVSSVTSLTNILDIKKTEEGIEVAKLIDKYNIPRKKEELEKLRNYVLSKELYRGKVVSGDGRITLILVKLKNSADKALVAKRIKSLTEEKIKESGIDVKVYYSGIPLQMEEVNGIILSDMKRLIPFVIICVVLILFLGFRSIRGIVLSLSAPLFATLWSVGMMGFTGVPLSIISNIMPVILIAVGTAYGIHFIARYREEIEKGKEVKKAVLDAYSEVGIPILLAGLTTFAGFLSFVGTYLRPVTHFGIFTSLGVLFSLLISLILVPAVLSFLPPMKGKYRYIESGAGFIEKIAEKMGKFVLKSEKIISTGGVIIFLFAVSGLLRIKTSVNMLEYFPKESNLRKSAELMKKKFGGDLPVQILIQADFKNPFVLKELFRMEKFMRTVYGIHNPQSLADLLAEMNYVMNGIYTIPETPEGVANLLFMLEGEEIMSQLVKTDYKEGLIQARFSEVETDAIINAYKKVEDYLGNNLKKDFIVERFLLDTLRDRKKIEYMISEVYQEIRWDVIYRSGDKSWDFPSLKDTLISFVKEKYIASLNAKEKIKNRIREFFEEESEIIFDESRIRSITDDILKRALDVYDKKSKINEILLSYIKDKEIRKDTELLNYTSSSLAEIVKEEVKIDKVERWSKRLLKLFPSNVRNDKDFLKDLKGDLWALVEEVHSFPSPGESSIKVSHSGLLPIYTKLHKNLWKSQIQSLILAFIIVTILISLQLKSPIAGIISTSPILLVIGFNFGLMGFLKIPLDNATMMIASIAIGIGIDYSIHFISRFRFEMERNMNEFLSLEKTLQTTGKAIFLNAFTVGLGFLILIFAQLLPLRTFGWMIALTMLTSALAATTFLPSMILISKRFFKFEKGGKT